MKRIAYGITDTGCKRRDNQDSFRLDMDSGFFAVADGMGGMRDGGLASRYAVDVLNELVMGIAAGEVDIDKVAALIKDAIIELNDLLRSSVGRNSGTTIVMVLLKGDRAIFVHMGDSRAYLFRDSELSRLTEDHNLFALLQKTHRFTEEELREDKAHHMLIRYLGMENPRPDVKAIAIKPGDRFLLCTDGLSEMVKDDAIAETMRTAPGPKEALRRLVAAAKSAGGYDNITAVIVE